MATDDHSLLRVRLLFCLIGFAEAAFVPFLPLLLRDRGLDAQAIGAALALMAGLGFARSTVAVLLAGSLIWFFRSPALPLADALALDRLGAHRRDAYGTVRLWMSVTFAVGAIGWGLILEAFG